MRWPVAPADAGHCDWRTTSSMRSSGTPMRLSEQPAESHAVERRPRSAAPAAEPRTLTKDPEDPAVITAARAGERAALAVICDAHKEMLAHWVLRMTGDGASVDDLVQEVFVAAFSAFPRSRGEASVRSWLRAIAINRVRNWWDAQRRRQARESQVRDWVADRRCSSLRRGRARIRPPSGADTD